MTGHADAVSGDGDPGAAEQTATSQPPGDVNDVDRVQNAGGDHWSGVSQWQDSTRNSRGETTGTAGVIQTTLLHGIGVEVGTPPLRRRHPPTIGGAAVATTRGRMETTLGAEDLPMFNKSEATEGTTNEELPGRMGEQIGDLAAIRVIEDPDHGMGVTPTTTEALRGEDGLTTRMEASRVASEKLAVPSFTGDDTDDVGSSARSYLRQIEAWRRMTLLPASQQGLVLYQNLGGKAWIAAEELSVPRLASESGVGYFVSWINARLLDLEVARIGKAFSDFFRRLKRKPGQTIREYNSEYDRLHARLREVGCSIPQECAAWLYIDRLQLDEPQELNLLASVGNEYNLHRLQQAAVLHDRGHRKPWESSKSRKPYTAHITESPDGASDDADGDQDLDLEDGVPEDVAVAYATYQSAKDRYKEHVKARGFQGDRSQGQAKEATKKGDQSKDEKIKIMKARSFCGSCGKKGHWHRDPECPNFGTSAQGVARAVKEVGVCHHVPAEVFTLKHDGTSLLGITDTACAKVVTGTMWLQQYSDVLKSLGGTPELVRESESFRFGTGKVHHSSFHVILRFSLGSRVVEMRTSVINGDVPLLMSKPALAQLGMIYDVAENRADFTRVGLTGVDLVTTSSGHPAIPIDSTTKPTTSPTPTTGTTKAPHYKIFYDKKLSPVVKELLTQDRLYGVSFMNWWEKTNINSDFWLEGDSIEPVRSCRDAVFGGKTGDPVQYFTYGLFSHGGVVGLTRRTREQDNVVRYLNGYAKHHLGPEATWSSVSLARDVKTEVHHDYQNLKGTSNYTVNIGQKTGGGVWLEDKDLTEDNLSGGVKWRRTGTGQRLPGRVYDAHNKFFQFDPFLKHGSELWTGTRWCITYHTTRNLYKASTGMKKFLKGRSIFNNAAKIGVMLATLVTTAGSYMAEHVFPTVEANPVVIFEIGGVDATHEAAAIGKDVFEPMTWERYRSPEGKESAYHIVNGGGPRELRINLEGKFQECDEALLALIRQQLDDGGTVVVTGENEKVFFVFFKNKEQTKAVQCGDRVHEVKVVSTAKPSDDKGDLPMGATGISFGKDTPRNVATALRRLHQNLGHPRQEDLIRHLRLANAAPKIARPSTIPPMADFNDTLGLALFFCHDTDDVKHAFLSVVDNGTTYHLAIKVDGQSAEDIEAKFNDMWLIPFGPPKAVVIDLAGVVERQQAWWKHVWDKVSYQYEVELVVPVINAAKNDLRRRCGYSPSQWVFGKAPRVPEDLQDPDGGAHVLWDVSEDAKYQRQSAMRAAARVAFHESQTDGRLRKALLQRTRVSSRPLDVGESVHLWHKPKNRRRGCWTGPAVIVGKEGGNYWLSKGGRCRLTSAEHIRPTTAEEVGALLAMKGTQREVERLLDHDPDADEVYQDGDDMDYLDEILEGEMSWDEDDAPGDPGNDEGVALEPLLGGDGGDLPEKELKWAEIPPEVHDKFREAERKQWEEHLSFDALEPLGTDESERVRREVPADRVLRSRWAYKDKNWSRRREGEDLPWKCKSRLVIAGHTDPDLCNEEMQLSTDAPTLSRSGLTCMLQRTADGLCEEDPWALSAGDIRCAFLTGSYLSRELYMHQPKTGLPGMLPGQLVKIKKNVFGLATSPHTWWQDLQTGIFDIEIELPFLDDKATHKFEQSALDPCILLRRVRNGSFEGEPVAYLGCHVDDLLIAAPRLLQERIQEALANKFEVQTWEVDKFEFLGSQIAVEGDKVTMTQVKYAETRLFTLDVPAGLDEGEPASPELVSDNRSLIGALSWMSAQTRPDLNCAVSMAQQLQKSPTIGDLKFTNGIAAKAHQFRDRGLEFRPIPKGRLMIIVYHDAAWANVPEPDPQKRYYVLTVAENDLGLQKEGPYSASNQRKAKKGNSKVASQLGILVTFADRVAVSGRACAEGLETGQYLRSMYESLVKGTLITVDRAELPILCLSDCRSLYDHLNRQGIPRVPSDKRLAVDLAALRQGLRSEKWGDRLPIAWIPGALQRGDVLTKPQNPSEWWDTVAGSLLLPLSIGQEGVLINNRKVPKGILARVKEKASFDAQAWPQFVGKQLAGKRANPIRYPPAWVKALVRLRLQNLDKDKVSLVSVSEVDVNIDSRTSWANEWKRHGWHVHLSLPENGVCRVALLSKIPFKAVKLREADGLSRHAAAFVDLQVAGRTMSVLCVAVYLQSGQIATADAQARDILISADYSGRPSLLFGDWNTTQEEGFIAETIQHGACRACDEAARGDRFHLQAQSTMAEVGSLSDHRVAVYQFDGDAPNTLVTPPRRRAPLENACDADFVFPAAVERHFQDLLDKDLDHAWTFMSDYAEDLLYQPAAAGLVPRSADWAPRPPPRRKDTDHDLDQSPGLRALRRLLPKLQLCALRPWDRPLVVACQAACAKARSYFPDLPRLQCGDEEAVRLVESRVAEVNKVERALHLRRWQDRMDQDLGAIRSYVKRRADEQLAWEEDPEDLSTASGGWHPAIAVKEQADEWLRKWKDLQRAMAAMRGKGGGVDGWLRSELLKLPLAWFRWAASLWNRILVIGKVPAQRRKARVALLRKSRRRTRPITLLCSLWRAGTRVIQAQLGPWIDTWADHTAAGGLPGTSVQAALMQIRKAMTDGAVAFIQTDIKSSFDSIHMEA
ncbi:RE2 [Symbiodinium sp. CCMP2592]|nr:RE2 [Symbiodinium sp. CCMP2592]